MFGDVRVLCCRRLASEQFWRCRCFVVLVVAGTVEAIVEASRPHFSEKQKNGYNFFGFCFCPSVAPARWVATEQHQFVNVNVPFNCQNCYCSLWLVIERFRYGSELLLYFLF